MSIQRALVSGVLISLAVVMISIRITVQQLGETPTTALLAGETDFAEITLTQQTKQTEFAARMAIAKKILPVLVAVLIAYFRFL